MAMKCGIFLGSSLHSTCRRGSGAKARADKSGKTCSQLYDGHAIDQTGETSLAELSIINKIKGGEIFYHLLFIKNI